VIGAVVPVCNRKQNLELLLASLEEQTSQNFTLVVADDGSTDGTREMVEKRATSAIWDGRLRWVGCGPDRGVRTGRARNIGAANLPASTELLLMLDSDLVMQPTAIADFATAQAAHPGQILLGAVEWLPPLDPGTVQAHITAGRLTQLKDLIPAGAPTRVEGTFTGPELRQALRTGTPGTPLPLRPEWALPLNSAWPLDLYWSVGGFDEAMTGYGYQDMELGARAAKAGALCSYHPLLWALHVWHPKPPRAMTENQRNLDFYLRRHGRNALIETDVDWSLWWHYHLERGGSLVEGEKRLWALNGDRTRRIELPDPTWITRLGHCAHAATPIDPRELDTIQASPKPAGQGRADD
jgi:glycosyltransferase involved in cell wall biosynthesis